MSALTFQFSINAPEVDSKHRHKYILGTFDQLASGEYLELKNNHDPRPLYYQFLHERSELFTWEYLEEGPQTWRVAIGKL